MSTQGWAERVAFINELPMHTAYCPGEPNSFGDLVSRIAAMMGEAASARKPAISESKSEAASAGTAAASRSKSKSGSTKGSAVWTGPTHRLAVWTVGINHQEEITCHHLIINDFGGS